MARKTDDKAAGRGGRYEIRDGARVRVARTRAPGAPAADPFGPPTRPTKPRGNAAGMPRGGDADSNKEG
ncbi:hypothetical protein KAJ83_09755 [Marivibrio halodurans]|uniref:Uncharacterized protein n=1 Tax=Marivibrio halodurans TaxID=2039722 RepID=A0A8J7S2C6_9PROT|nr:hypothetical protein [Marivibrio halodurans]MBP5857293.1 hypothetical protein [Marivibrio halodurans]